MSSERESQFRFAGLRRTAVLTLSAMVVLLGGCGGGGASSDASVGPVETVQLAAAPATTFGAAIVRNGDATVGIPVRFEPFDAVNLRELRERERLDEVVAPAHTEFERVLLLKNWVAAQFPHGNPDPYPPWDAKTILVWIRADITGGFCGQYSQVLLQSLMSMGMLARYVELGGAWNARVHFVVEVWSNDFSKWVLLDPDYNVHFERDGIPLSAIEIHDAFIGGEMQEVDVIKGQFLEGHYDAYDWPLRTAEVYYYVRVHMKADHLTRADEDPFDRYNDMVEFMDSRTVPWEFSQDGASYPKSRLTNLQTYERAEFAGAYNQVFVSIGETRFPTVQLSLTHNVVSFDHYEWRTVGSVTGAWTSTSGPSLEWEPRPNALRLEIRGVNSRNVPGPASVVEATFPHDPPRR